MKREDLIILILGFLLLAAMLLTFLFCGEKSRHGVGSIEAGGGNQDGGGRLEAEHLLHTVQNPLIKPT